MKVLVFCKSFASPTLTFIYNEVTELAKSAEVLVLTCKRENEDLFPFENVLEIPFKTFSKLDSYVRKLQHKNFFWAFKNRTFRKQLEKEVLEFAPDVIHLHFGFEALFFLENIKNNGIPIFISFHGYDASHKLTSLRYRKNILKWLSKPFVKPIFVSEFMKRHVENTLGKKIPQSKILYYGTDLEFFKREENSPSSHPIFLQVSSFAEKKGHEYTVLAFSKFIKRHPESVAKLVLAGVGPLLERIENLVEELKITDHVQFMGLVNRQQAKELMENASFFVHHSVTSASVGDMEGIPNAIMEAMAMELPVLSTFHSGIPELVEDGVHGFLVTERDIDAYADKMSEILSWNKQTKNREKVELFFEKKRHAKKLLEFYHAAIFDSKVVQ